MKKVLIASILCSGLMVGCSQPIAEKMTFDESVMMQEENEAEQYVKDYYYIALTDIVVITNNLNANDVYFDYGSHLTYDLNYMYDDEFSRQFLLPATYIKSGDTFKASQKDLIEEFYIIGEYEMINTDVE